MAEPGQLPPMKIVESGQRGRISLGSAYANTTYLVQTGVNGTILLVPVGMTDPLRADASANEKRLITASRVFAAIDSFIEDPRTGAHRERPPRAVEDTARAAFRDREVNDAD